MERTRNGWHTPNYYRIRGAVRFTFWTALFTGTVVIGKWIGDTAYGDPRPACPTILERDFTWSRSGDPFLLADCRPPLGTILNPDGTWEWDYSDP